MISGSQSPPRRYFYPRPPGGGRPGMEYILDNLKEISIHALRVEGDLLCRISSCSITCISIHALRVEGDAVRALPGDSSGQFLSTPSGWRATVKTSPWALYTVIFLSTPSGWRATSTACPLYHKSTDFYPRPPGGGRRFNFAFVADLPRNFYPRPPGGGRR